MRSCTRLLCRYCRVLLFLHAIASQKHANTFLKEIDFRHLRNIPRILNAFCHLANMQAMDESLPDSSLSTPTKRTDFCPTFSYLHRCALWINMLMYFARFSILSQPRLALLLEKWACSAAASKHRACASPNGQPLWLCAC